MSLTVSLRESLYELVVQISALRIVHQLWMIELPKKCTEARRAATAQLLDTAALGSEAAVVAAVCAADVQWAVALGDLQQADFTTAVVEHVCAVPPLAQCLTLVVAAA